MSVKKVVASCTGKSSSVSTNTNTHTSAREKKREEVEIGVEIKPTILLLYGHSKQYDV
jgi:hypothetical protein